MTTDRGKQSGQALIELAISLPLLFLLLLGAAE
jgi:Flp pilus assembly protein TadG